jgi:gamma-glutamyltranspeptidase/glutathione hydrolase
MRHRTLATGLVALIALVVTVAGCARHSSRTTESNPARFPTAAVAADHTIASEAGAEILRKGGNAVDAAVATSFALSVVRPYSCGIGGGGFMVIHFDGDPKFGTQSIALNYREMAPAAVGADYYEKHSDPKASTRGGGAVGVPGTVAGLLYALEHFGTLDRATVLAPAIRAAEEGFLVDEHYLLANADQIKWFNEDETRKTRFSFVWERFLKLGQVKLGDRIALPEQAAALRLIALHGADSFYKGRIGIEILHAVRRDGGPMRAEDLLKYEVALVEPLRFEAFGHTFLTMPPPSSGGVALAQTLGILQRRRDEFGRRANGVDYVHVTSEALKHAFADRARWMGDPAQVDVPVGALLADSYLDERAKLIDPRRARDVETYGTVPPDDAGTSHFCVIDGRGNAVACTETINLEFGSMLAVEKFGFCLNNEMDDFTTKRGQANAFGLVQSARNAPAPGKRPLSSMTPTIVLDRDGRVVMIAGASGGPRIITGTMQAMLGVLLFDMDASAALAQPRFHHQWMPNALLLERAWHREANADGTVAQLESRGHKVEPTGSVGNVQLIRRDKKGRTWDAACDPRKGGRPAGY